MNSVTHDEGRHNTITHDFPRNMTNTNNNSHSLYGYGNNNITDVEQIQSNQNTQGYK